MKQVIELFGCRFVEGQAASAPTMGRDRMAKETCGDGCCLHPWGDERYEKGICAIDILPRRGDPTWDRCEKDGVDPEERLEDEGLVDLNEQVGLKIAKEIQGRSGKYGRKKKSTEEQESCKISTNHSCAGVPP